jgi:hypothetical protein
MAGFNSVAKTTHDSVKAVPHLFPFTWAVGNVMLALSCTARHRETRAIEHNVRLSIQQPANNRGGSKHAEIVDRG